jgi:tetratricopeptide (TPR) repeat protein
MRLWCLLASVTLFSSLAGPALAQPASVPGDYERAKALFDGAQIHYEQKEYEAALAGYRGAYKLTGAPEIMFNIAQCHRLLGQREDALTAYERFLKDVPDTPYRAEIERYIGELKATAPRGPGEKRRGSSRLLVLFSGATGAVSVGFAAAGLGAALAARGEVRGEQSQLPDPFDADTERAGRLTRLGSTLGNVSSGLAAGALVGLAAALLTRRGERKAPKSAASAPPAQRVQR